MSRRTGGWRSALAAAALFWAACEREARPFRSPSAELAPPATTLSPLAPGPSAPGRSLDEAPFQENAYALAEGKRLFTEFNCSGCHGLGGGGMGPPLMDEEWIYGSDPANIFATIVEGRPNGMPAFGGRIPEDRIWWIVGYVRSMSGLAPKSARPGRSDQFAPAPPEVSREPESGAGSPPPPPPPAAAPR